MSACQRPGPAVKTAPGQAHKESIARARAAGREARTSLPRRDFAALTLPERDPVGILEGQHATRLADLIPVRVGRMLQTPFSFYRGAAAVMAHDLADSSVTGHTLIASGDAHLANFGLFASPERRLIFDPNDFDEAYPAPWEWDIKRLGAGIWLNGRISSHTEEQCGTAVRACVRSYREALKARSTLRSDTSLLLSQYHLVDFARRIVGVGSVGTRSWVLRFEGPAGEPLFLQAKEAGKSVLQTHGRVLLPPELIEKALITRDRGTAWRVPSGSFRRSRTRSWAGSRTRRAMTDGSGTSTFANSVTGRVPLPWRKTPRRPRATAGCAEAARAGPFPEPRQRLHPRVSGGQRCL